MIVTSTQALIFVGINPKLRGFAYAEYALQLLGRDVGRLRDMEHRLFPAIAKRYGVHISAVERNMRYAISRAWDNDYTALRGYCEKRGIGGYCPTVKEFLGILMVFPDNSPEVMLWQRDGAAAPKGALTRRS